MNLDKSFEVENGVIVNNGPFFTGGPSSPVGLNLPVETYYVQTTSSGAILWRKFNTGINDWSKCLFNDFYQYAEDSLETSTTSTTTYLNKLTITTPSLPLGDYELDFNFLWRAGQNRLIDIRVQLNGVNLIQYSPFTPNASGVYDSGRILKLSSISGVNTITLDFKVTGSNTTVYMKNASMSIRRIL